MKCGQYSLSAKMQFLCSQNKAKQAIYQSQALRYRKVAAGAFVEDAKLIKSGTNRSLFCLPKDWSVLQEWVFSFITNRHRLNNIPPSYRHWYTDKAKVKQNYFQPCKEQRVLQLMVWPPQNADCSYLGSVWNHTETEESGAALEEQSTLKNCTNAALNLICVVLKRHMLIRSKFFFSLLCGLLIN